MRGGGGRTEREKAEKNDTEKRANLEQNDTENAKVVKKSVEFAWGMEDTKRRFMKV